LIKPKTKAKPNPATKSRSTKSVPATTTPTSGTEKKWRSDGAHVIGNTGSNLQTNVEPRTQNSSKKAKRPASPTGRKPSKYLMIQIGLLIYLFGHGLTVWAFLAGNFGAWCRPRAATK